MKPPALLEPTPRANEKVLRSPIDVFGRGLKDLRLSVIDRCNLRCQYCMPSELFGPDFRFLPESQLMSFDEIERLVSSFLEVGVEKIRITGGEPLLRPRLPELVARIRSLSADCDLALTTNGIRLARIAHELAKAGLNRVNLSLDAIDSEIGKKMAGRAIDFSTSLNGIVAAREAGLGIKLNAVIKRGINECQILPLAQFAREQNINLRFIEYMDVGETNGWDKTDVVTGAEVLAILKKHYPLTQNKPRQGSEIAATFQYLDADCAVGFINSISQPFCGGCVRARVSAEGKLFTCLFGSDGYDLRPWLTKEFNKEQSLTHKITKIWNERKDRHSELRDKQSEISKRQEMWTLGG
ncbi:GTP 3',8-cyclase MoaA [Rubellicoccus peritrichatus]|uniref:GTP 3',8-cyclase n=1 Tax=Rubellicoccus peritrichatus TaxID=3080537 RepID=A0AAQ3LE11_9BACT|nr:GTP 3',8-cyclase MoaA [Puniceicoccus sp. CR14]WOO42892.1 GTP 3',8-cyclase MoaA [Puniceicoccus sp. CR14]